MADVRDGARRPPGLARRALGRVLPHRPRLAALAAALVAGLPAAAAIAAGTATRDAIVVRPEDEGLAGDADAASQGTVDGEQLENRPLLRPAEVLEVIPGLIVTQHSGTGKANQYFLRGFNLDHGTDFAVHVDGMPVNMPSHGHGQGYADLNFLIPELIEHFHYRKGPYYADQGDFSAAGAAYLELKRSLPAASAELSAGGYGYRRTLLSGSREAGDGSVLGALELGGGNGPWNNPEKLRKLNGLLRLSQGTERNGFTLTGMAYSARWNATDQIPLRAVDAGTLPRFGAVDPTDGGRASRASLSAQWIRTGDASTTTASAYVVRSRLDLYSNFTYFLDDPVNGDQFEQVDRRTVAGGDVTHKWRGAFDGLPMTHTLGARLRTDDIGQVALFNTAARQRIGTVRDDAVRQTSLGLYYQNSTTWSRWLRSELGLRADTYRFRVNSDTPANSGRAADSILTPKLGLVMGPWKNVEYFANYGHGFHSNDARGATIAVDPATGAPAERVKPLVRAKGGELGLRAAPLRGLQTSVALWRLDIASELLFVGDAGTTEPSRPSRRQGVEWANFYKVTPQLTADADLTLSSARFVGDDPANPGHRVPGAADKTLSAGLTYGGETGWNGGLRLRYFGPRPLVTDGSQRSGASALVNARIGYAVNRQFRLALEVLNLFDRKVDDITYFYTSRLAGEPAAGVADKHFHPIEPRTLRFAATISF